MAQIEKDYNNNFKRISSEDLLRNYQSNNDSQTLEQTSETNETPDAYKGEVFFESGRYLQRTLLAQTDGLGGASNINADSPPEKLLKDPRIRAMLDVIAFAEGTRGNGDYRRVVYGTVIRAFDGNAPYDRSLVGKRNVLVNNLQNHPNLLVQVNPNLRSTAAGRYQFLYGTWQGLNMPDFSQHSQDIAAIKLMQRRGMIEPLLNGDFNAAIHKGAPEWASLPVVGGGSYYGGQGAKNLSDLRRTYSTALQHYRQTEPTSPSPNPTSPPTNAVLSRGNRGQKVEVLQNKLIRLGFMTEAQKQTGPGIFGPRTEAAVKKFQKSVGISQTGRYDAATNQSMNRILNGKLRRGETGRAVGILQDRLIRLGLMTEAQKQTGPGIFGPKTENSVKKFQQSVGLSTSGQYDTATRQAMDKIISGKVKRGIRGDIVRGLQKDLVRLGYMTQTQVKTGPGIFGPQTEAALKRFQGDHGISRTGIYGSQTFRAMQSAERQVNNGRVQEYRRWNVYSTGHQPARLADGYEDLQPHHDYQSVNYVMRGLNLNRSLQARDIVLTRPGQSNFGQAVPSPLSGEVLFAGDENDGYGKKVVVKNNQTGQLVMLGHLESLNVRRGQTVSYGQNVGGQGSTGHSTGAHIHINADSSVIRRWVADLADGKFDGVRQRFDIGRKP